MFESVNTLSSAGLCAAADAFKALKYGDPEKDASIDEEVGFLMLAKIFQCFVVDHMPSKRGEG